MSGDECPVCIDAHEPCEKCRRAIHQSWHKQGMWWVREEECDESCECWSETIERRKELDNMTPRRRAQMRFLERERNGDMSKHTTKYYAEVHSGIEGKDWHRSGVPWGTFAEAAEYGSTFLWPLVRVVAITTIEETSEVLNVPK